MGRSLLHTTAQTRQGAAPHEAAGRSSAPQPQPEASASCTETLGSACINATPTAPSRWTDLCREKKAKRWGLRHIFPGRRLSLVQNWVPRRPGEAQSAATSQPQPQPDRAYRRLPVFVHSSQTSSPFCSLLRPSVLPAFPWTDPSAHHTRCWPSEHSPARSPGSACARPPALRPPGRFL